MSEKKYNPLDVQTSGDAKWLHDNYDYCFCVSKGKGEKDAVVVVSGDLHMALQAIGVALKSIAEIEEDGGKKNVEFLLLSGIMIGLMDDKSTGNIFDFRKVVNTDGK